MIRATLSLFIDAGVGYPPASREVRRHPGAARLGTRSGGKHASIYGSSWYRLGAFHFCFTALSGCALDTVLSISNNRHHERQTEKICGNQCSYKSLAINVTSH